MTIPSAPDRTTMPPDLETARAARDEAKRRLGGVPEVIGVGLTRRDRHLVVKVNLRRSLPDGVIPRFLLGVPLVTEVVGPVDPQATSSTP